MQEPQETWTWYLGQEDPLEESMATHSSILAWRLPQTEEPGRLQFTGLQSQTWLERLSMHANDHFSPSVAFFNIKYIII